MDYKYGAHKNEKIKILIGAHTHAITYVDNFQVSCTSAFFARRGVNHFYTTKIRKSWCVNGIIYTVVILNLHITCVNEHKKKKKKKKEFLKKQRSLWQWIPMYSSLTYALLMNCISMRSCSFDKDGLCIPILGKQRGQFVGAEQEFSLGEPLR